MSTAAIAQTAPVQPILNGHGYTKDQIVKRLSNGKHYIVLSGFSTKLEQTAEQAAAAALAASKIALYGTVTA